MADKKARAGNAASLGVPLSAGRFVRESHTIPRIRHVLSNTSLEKRFLVESKFKATLDRHSGSTGTEFVFEFGWWARVKGLTADDTSLLGW